MKIKSYWRGNNGRQKRINKKSGYTTLSVENKRE